MLAQTTFGVFAPAGTPRAIIDRVNEVTQQALTEEAFQQELLRLGFEPLPGIGPGEAAALFEDERLRWAPILKNLGTRPG
jgi:tripartite-type tricarboxylate transporter receptor subunit TctC